MSDYQKSFSLAFWPHITYQPVCTCWIMLELGIFQTRLTNSQVWERFQSLASELILPTIQIISGEEANKAALNFTASVAWAYR
jgi:hypothetical protein